VEEAMRDRTWTRRVSLALVLSAVLASSFTMAGQTPGSLSNYRAPRTPWGDPDLQGTWNVATLTPIERPDNVGGRMELTADEAREIERVEALRVQRGARPSDPNRAAPEAGGGVGGYNNVWIDRGDSAFMVNGKYRTSIIIDPPDGRIPPQTAEARKRNAGARGTALRPTSDAPESAGADGVGAFDDMELRPLGERCLLGFSSTSGPPTLPNYFYNNYKQIVQTPTHVMILYEMVHDVRIIPLNATHRPSTMRFWLGDSIGRWEGDTLVVETTNFTDKTRFRGSSPDMKVTERFTRTEDGQIVYRFTIDDPKTWAVTWTGEYPWVRSNERIYEYACHEGNYALEHIMRGARYQDKVAAGQAPPSGVR
jgi:hypothetical protein